MQTLPILMIGSIALLLAVLPIDAWQGLITDLGIKAKLLAGSTLTTSLIALYSCFCIGYQLAIQYNCSRIDFCIFILGFNAIK